MHRRCGAYRSTTEWTRVCYSGQNLAERPGSAGGRRRGVTSFDQDGRALVFTVRPSQIDFGVVPVRFEGAALAPHDPAVVGVIQFEAVLVTVDDDGVVAL